MKLIIEFHLKHCINSFYSLRRPTRQKLSIKYKDYLQMYKTEYLYVLKLF